jgi:hypothetical protein
MDKKLYRDEINKSMPQYSKEYKNSDDMTKAGIVANQTVKSFEKIETNEDEIEGSKEEAKEATTAASSGSFVGMFDTEIKKNNLFQPGTEIKVVREEEPEEDEVKKIEAKEATTATSSGQYDVPFGNGGKNPLKVDGNKSVKNRIKTIRSKGFPMYGGGGKFVEPNEKCKRFPYCNQGDINVVVFSENRLVKQAINNISKKYKLNKEYIKSIIFENVDIYYKNIEMNKEIENIVDTIVERVLNEEIQNKTKQITESVSGEIDEMEEFYEIAKMRKEERMAKKVETTESEIDEDELGEAAYEYAAAKAKVAGKENFDFGGETHDVTMDLETAKKIVGESKKTIKLTEEEIIDLIEKIVNEEKIEGTGQQEKAMKETKKINDSHAKEIAEKMSKYVKDGSSGKFEENPTDFPKGNGDMKEMDKKAFQTSEDADEFIETYAYPGMLEVDYDIQPSEERVEKYVKGHSETGNAEIDEDGKPTGNVVPNKELGEKLMKKYKDGKYQENKEAVSYNRVPQPVIERPYDEAGEKKIKPAKITKETIEGKKINEDIDRMKNLMSHSYKTQ